MKTRDVERRAFLRSLKPQIVELRAQVAQEAGRTVTQVELDADIASAKAEYHTKKPRLKRSHVALQG